MNTYKKAVKNICDEVYNKDFQQITIDLIQEGIEEELINEREVSREDVGAAAYDCSILLEVMNPVFDIDVQLLTKLYKALKEWDNDIELNNGLLGLPKES